MQTHDDDERETTSGLSTEDLAQADQAGEERETAVYPGQATGDAMPGESATDRDAGEPTTDRGFGEPMTDQDIGEPATDRDAGSADDGAATGADAGSDEEQPLLAPGDAERYRTAWSEIQGRFVDDPRAAVTSADTLVAEVMQSLAGTFATYKQELEGQWQRGDDVATEDLRMALQHYRSFFNRLLKT
ncbi:hypothetical protein [Streptomyces sp. ISL-94]|uniref:hypothetical protein n=1 Tax=Streptomyces sp. ISL-94 TaxID=2819190 RepID=UPI001BEB09FC|nr:hypothetical protein [Streptomyces sp. ISL-94]MBT2479930.1 hypothetical protein [Streptomyces sp. ISL-94]